jgi:hypothetical protein
MTDPRDYGPTPTEAIQLDVDLLESQFRIARMMSYGPLKDEAGE